MASFLPVSYMRGNCPMGKNRRMNSRETPSRLNATTRKRTTACSQLLSRASCLPQTARRAEPAAHRHFYPRISRAGPSLLLRNLAKGSDQKSARVPSCWRMFSADIIVFCKASTMTSTGPTLWCFRKMCFAKAVPCTRHRFWRCTPMRTPPRDGMDGDGLNRRRARWSGVCGGSFGRGRDGDLSRHAV